MPLQGPNAGNRLLPQPVNPPNPAPTQTHAPTGRNRHNLSKQYEVGWRLEERKSEGDSSQLSLTSVAQNWERPVCPRISQVSQKTRNLEWATCLFRDLRT